MGTSSNLVYQPNKLSLLFNFPVTRSPRCSGHSTPPDWRRSKVETKQSRRKSQSPPTLAESLTFANFTQADTLLWRVPGLCGICAREGSCSLRFISFMASPFLSTNVLWCQLWKIAECIWFAVLQPSPTTVWLLGLNNIVLRMQAFLLNC